MWFRSFYNLTDRIELDAVLRAVSRLPDPAVPAYAELAVHIGWTTAGGLELAVVGDNLLHDHHPEFGGLQPREEFRRSVFAQVTWAFR
jgi:iron complex outermembrane receptor protein